MHRSDVFLRKQVLPKYRQQTLWCVSDFGSQRLVSKVTETHVQCMGAYIPHDAYASRRLQRAWEQQVQAQQRLDEEAEFEQHMWEQEQQFLEERESVSMWWLW